MAIKKDTLDQLLDGRDSSRDHSGRIIGYRIRSSTQCENEKAWAPKLRPMITFDQVAD
jgi:hypothetical protein